MCFVSLALSIYWSIAYPGQSPAFLLGLFMVTVLGMLTCLVSLTSQKATSLKAPMVSVALSVALATPSVCLLTSQMSFFDARKNLGGSTPAIATEVSNMLRENPANLLGVFRKASAITPASLNPQDLRLFEAAAMAGIKSKEIDRVMSNGMVLRGDKDALIETLMAKASEIPYASNNREIYGLLLVAARDNK